MLQPPSRRVPIPLPSTPSGKQKRACPRGECPGSEFYLGEGGTKRDDELPSDLHRRPNTVGTTCPYCGYDGDDDDFLPADVAQYVDSRINHEAEEFAEEVVDNLLGQLAKSVKRRGRGRNSLQIKTRSQARTPPRQRPQPPKHQDQLRNVQCHICDRSYGVFALGLFCPDCGSPNLTTHLIRERELIEDDLREAERLIRRGEDEHAHRRIADTHENVVSIVEAFLKTFFAFVVRQRENDVAATKTLKNVGNAFQNIDRAREKLAPFGIDPFADLTPKDIAFLRIAMAKRHVVTHNLGLIDDRFVKQTGIGATGRVVDVSPTEVRRLLDEIVPVIDRCDETIACVR